MIKAQCGGGWHTCFTKE